MQRYGAIVGVCLLIATAYAVAADAAEGHSDDTALAAARRYVRQSDRYLDHARLKRGMTGYGLTVMSGTMPDRFDVEIVSVMHDWGPHQDVILARLSGTCGGVDLAESGVISGMSGSPVYIRDPRDGVDKIIGAVAYGWNAQNKPQCGIQPIAQMLAAARGADERQRPGDRLAAAGGPGRDGQAEWLDVLLSPRKRDFAAWHCARAGTNDAPSAAGRRLVPLRTPLLVSNVPPEAMGDVRGVLAPLGLVPLASGAIGEADRRAVGDVDLRPGGALAVTLVTGDADWVAVGTVTDVVDGRVLGFGHAFQGDGAVALPMGPGYVHTVVSSLLGSFKLGSTIRINGTIDRDEITGVAGRLGPRPSLVPLRVAVNWTATGRKQTYTFNLCRHRLLTVAMARLLIQGVARGWHALPPQHTVDYTAEVRFADLPAYRVDNIASGENITELVSDVSRPLVAMLDNPLGPPATLERIDVEMTIRPTSRLAVLRELRLDADTYRPGETVTGEVVFRPFRGRRKAMPVRFELPAELPEGAYTLTAMDYLEALVTQQAQRPHEYAPETPAELFAALQRVVGTRADKLYLHMPLPEGGLALDKRELPSLPASKARVIVRARPLQTHVFRKALLRTVQTRYDIDGAVSASFRVRKRPHETRLRRTKDQTR